MEDATNTMVTSYDPSKPIIKLFIQIEKELKINFATSKPFTNAQIISKAYILVHMNVL